MEANASAQTIAHESDRFFDESSRVSGHEPELALIAGGVAVGKTRFRRQRYARGYVVVDAGDIFIALSQGNYIDFPSMLEEPMNTIGSLVARRAVRERRSIVCELVGPNSNR